MHVLLFHKPGLVQRSVICRAYLRDSRFLQCFIKNFKSACGVNVVLTCCSL